MPGRPQTFQCSSASRKFLNRSRRGFQGTTCRRFSALQRAENSSIGVGDVDDFRQQLFQCSSASRKFLNGFVMCSSSWFSIAFQCSSASRKFLNRFVPVPGLRPLLFQCSSASRKFLNVVDGTGAGLVQPVSVLFSEPKIPQSVYHECLISKPYPFQCSSASRKFLNPKVTFLRTKRHASRFQCSSASRKFLNFTRQSRLRILAKVSVLFSEPKIPQYQ